MDTGRTRGTSLSLKRTGTKAITAKHSLVSAIRDALGFPNEFVLQLRGQTLPLQCEHIKLARVIEVEIQ